MKSHCLETSATMKVPIEGSARVTLVCTQLSYILFTQEIVQLESSHTVDSSVRGKSPRRQFSSSDYYNLTVKAKYNNKG